MFKTILSKLDLSIPAGTSEQQLGQGDFNGDGIVDLFIPYINGQTGGTATAGRFFLGQANGGFAEASSSLFTAPLPSPMFGARMVMADFNGDGRNDVFLIDSGLDAPPFPGGQNLLYLTAPNGKVANGTAGLPQALFFGHGGTAGDIDGDGDIDIIGVSINRPDAGEVQVLVNDGKGAFTEKPGQAPLGTQASAYQGDLSAALVDVDGDGDLDLITGADEETNHPNAVYLNNGKGDFSGQQGVPLPLSGVLKAHVVEIEVTDLNFDGKPDLILSATNGAYGTPDFYTVAYMQVLIGEGGGKFRDETASRLPQSVNGDGEKAWIKWIDAADLNGDGAKDLIVSRGTQGVGNTTQIYMNDGQGRFSKLADGMEGWATPLRAADGTITAFATAYWGGLKVIANDIPSLAPIRSTLDKAYAAILRQAPDAARDGLSASLAAMTNKISVGSLSQASAIGEVIKAADATTSVASMNYQFFTGKVPSQVGIDFLISPTGPNATNLNSAYYAKFDVVNRYINFAVNLGKNGEAKDSFLAKYGSLSLIDATKEAYKAIFGSTPTDAKAHALIDARVDYLAYYGGDGQSGIGTKAAMVGFLLAAAATEDVGVLAKSNDAWLTDLSDGSAPFAVNILDPATGYYKADFIFGGN